MEDSDLWRRRYGDDTRDVVNYLSIFRNEPETFLKLMQSDITEIKNKGNIISQYTSRQIADQMTFQPISVKVGEHIIPAFNFTSQQSVSGTLLSEQLGKAVLVFFIKGRSVKLSFRSRDGQLPTALDLASIVGGGGHKNAAGGEVSLEEFIKMIVL